MVGLSACQVEARRPNRQYLTRNEIERKMNRNTQILHLPLNFVVAFAQKYVGEAKEISPVRSESYTQR